MPNAFANGLKIAGNRRNPKGAIPPVMQPKRVITPVMQSDRYKNPIAPPKPITPINPTVPQNEIVNPNIPPNTVAPVAPPKQQIPNSQSSLIQDVLRRKRMLEI